MVLDVLADFHLKSPDFDYLTMQVIKMFGTYTGLYTGSTLLLRFRNNGFYGLTNLMKNYDIYDYVWYLNRIDRSEFDPIVLFILELFRKFLRKFEISDY